MKCGESVKILTEKWARHRICHFTMKPKIVEESLTDET